MKMPKLTQPSRNSSRPGFTTKAGVEPQGCSTLKKIACAGAVAACAAVCVGSAGSACAACFAGLGMGSCIDCL